MSAPRETEIKLRVDNIESAEKRLRQIGATLVAPRYFEENMLYDDASQTLRSQGLLLRLRLISRNMEEAPHKAVLTFKGQAQISDGVKDREEIECEVFPAATFQQILVNLGYTTGFRYQKFRAIYSLHSGKLHVCVDETPIGNFLELEGKIELIHSVAKELGFERQQYITESYATLFRTWNAEQKRADSNMVFLK